MRILTRSNPLDIGHVAFQADGFHTVVEKHPRRDGAGQAFFGLAGKAGLTLGGNERGGTARKERDNWGESNRTRKRIGGTIVTPARAFVNQDYSAEFKAQAVLKVWTGNRACDVVADELGVSSADLARWVEQAERTAPEVFRANKDRQNSGLIKQLSKERERLTLEVQWLRGKLAMVATGADVSASPSDPGQGGRARAESP